MRQLKSRRPETKSRRPETKSGIRLRRDKPSGPQTELLYLEVVAREGDDEEEVEELCYFWPPPFPLEERPYPLKYPLKWKLEWPQQQRPEAQQRCIDASMHRCMSSCEGRSQR